MKEFVEKRTIPVKGEYDLVVVGAGVAGLAAAVTAAREGLKVLILEKSCELGGLATLGQINYYVPMCNGHGKQIVKGLCDEFIALSVKYGFDTTPEEWKNGEPGEAPKARYAVRYSACMFALALNELLKEEGIEVSYDSLGSEPVMEGGHCKGIIIENKSGRAFVGAKVVADTTGDADILYRAGVPTVEGINYHSYFAYAMDIAHCEKAVETGCINDAVIVKSGGNATLFGKFHPEGKPFYTSINGENVNEYLISNQLEMLEKIKKEGGDKEKSQVINLPGMCQFRTTRRLDGDYTLRQEDCYRHFEDSVTAVNDFEHADFLWEVPYRTLVKTGFDNLITAGRTASGENYAWDVLRVIPPAIVTGQAAGLAAALSIESGRPIYDIDVTKLQEKLGAQNVMLHFDDAWVPAPGTGKDVMSITKLDQFGHVANSMAKAHDEM